MVKFILGKKGAGKTKWLIDEANKEIDSGNGNIAFIDVEDDHIFSLKPNVRLINAKDYGVDTLSGLYGFISGMLAMDYDLEKIYIDSVYKVIPLRAENLEAMKNELERISKKSECEIYINVDYSMDEVSEAIQSSSHEVI